MTQTPGDDRAAERTPDDLAEQASPPSTERVSPAANGAGEDAQPRAASPDGEADAREELEQVRAQYQRALADYQNLQRRARQDRMDFERHTVTALVLNFLPVLDDLDRALDSVEPEFEQHRWVEGVRLVRQKFEGVLNAIGVREIPAADEAFNPAYHEAVGRAPGEEGRVVHVVQAGFKLGEHVVRPARVLVGSGEPPAPAGDAPEAGADTGVDGPQQA